MKIILATGIFPPEIGGPAQYAKNLKVAIEKSGHQVDVLTYGFEKRLPAGIRHAYFFLRLMSNLFFSDGCIALDTFSVGFPSSIAGFILRKKVVIRAGGDFLWEQYVERTGKKVLLRKFYDTEMGNFSLKEKLIFLATRWALSKSFKVVFSTKWQKNIWKSPYSISSGRVQIIENYYGKKELSSESVGKIFVSGTRKLRWKNTDMLERAFNEAKARNKELVLDSENLPYGDFMDKIRNCYAVILVSLGDISPNMILDAIRLNKPFILTEENGLRDRLGNIGIFVDPLDQEEITKKILWISESENYSLMKKRVESFEFTHTWDDIAGEFLKLFHK